MLLRRATVASTSTLDSHRPSTARRSYEQIEMHTGDGVTVPEVPRGGSGRTVTPGDARGEGATPRRRSASWRRRSRGDVVAAEGLGERHDAVAQRFHASMWPALARSAGFRFSQMISDEPPPMSNRTIDSASRSASSPQPATASEASVSRSTISAAVPGACAPRRGTRRRFPRRGSFGRDETRPRHAARPSCRGIRAARPACARSPLRSAARLRQPFAQANDARERVDDPKSFGGRTRDQQAAVVGAQIQRGVGPGRPLHVERRRADRARRARARRAHRWDRAKRQLLRCEPNRARDDVSPRTVASLTRMQCAKRRPSGLEEACAPYRDFQVDPRRGPSVEFEHATQGRRRNERLRQRSASAATRITTRRGR